MLNLCWLIHKDLVSEFRAKRAWPAMLLLGMVVAVLFAAQLELLPDQKRQMSGVMLWLAIFFAGVTAIDRSCSAEQLDGCWEGLLAYPLSPAVVYWSKVLVNVIALVGLECLLVPSFVSLTGVDLLRPFWAILLVGIWANLSLAAVGTLVSALSNGIRQGGPLLVLVLLPLSIPVLLAAAESTRLIALGQINGEWWRWLQLLGGFAVIFLTAGTILFEFVTED